MFRILVCLGLLFSAALTLATSASAQMDEGRRLALVVGNSDYKSVYPLKNAVNDSRSVAEVLDGLGFEVISVENADHAEFEKAVSEVASMANDATAVVFYYSGHGFQLGGANYLVPTDAVLSDRNKIQQETLRLDEIIGRLQARDRQTLVFLDACRNNPLPKGVQGSGDGLAQIETGSGTFVAFATQPGNITRDGAGDNSPFTLALLENIETPGISISDMMIRVRNEVEEKTLQEQTPWDQSSLRSQFYFVPAEETDAALTEEDRELLMSLDPEMRKKFEVRFGIQIDDLSDGESSDDEQDVQVASIQPTLNIQGVSEGKPAAQTLPADIVPTAKPDVSTPSETSTEAAAPEAVTPPPADEPTDEPTKVYGNLVISSVDEDETPAPADASATVAKAPDPQPNSERSVTETVNAAGPTLSPLEQQSLKPVTSGSADVVGQEVEMAAVDPDVAKLNKSPLLTPAREMPRPAKSQKTQTAAESPEENAPLLTLLDPQPLPIPGRRPGEESIEVAALETPGTPDKTLLGVDEPSAALDVPDDLPRAIQAELSRLGCYRSSIDGIWGNNSARALLRFYAQKKEAPENTNPDVALYSRLTQEEVVVCKRTETRPTKKSAPKAVKRSTPTRQKATTKRASKPAATSSRKKTSARKSASSAPAPKKKLGKSLSIGTFR